MFNLFNDLFQQDNDPDLSLLDRYQAEEAADAHGLKTPAIRDRFIYVFLQSRRDRNRASDYNH